MIKPLFFFFFLNISYGRQLVFHFTIQVKVIKTKEKKKIIKEKEIKQRMKNDLRVDK